MSSDKFIMINSNAYTLYSIIKLKFIKNTIELIYIIPQKYMIYHYLKITPF